MAGRDFDTVLVIDFGSQYTQLIARRIRERGVYAEILPCTASIDDVRAVEPVALILSGGPASLYDDGAPDASPELLALDVPVLGICYGMQWIARELGGDVRSAEFAEYGRREVEVGDAAGSVLANVPARTITWMSHRDQIAHLPGGFRVIGRSETCPVAALADDTRRFHGLQFHPEVRHTEHGAEIIDSFLFEIARARRGWSMEAFEHEQIRRIRERVGDGHVIGGVSGGVDSTVMSALLNRAIGDRFLAVFVDNGLLRKGEATQVRNTLHGELGVNLVTVDAGDRFLAALAGVTDPEDKRRRIGHTFIEVFDEEAVRQREARFLAQGTLYPDVIESISHRGPSATIKTHHNVGGLPDGMRLELIEPLRELFKDEVRELGRRLALPERVVNRHPFPGPGLAVRILGEVTRERLAVLREADAIFIEELRAAGWYENTSQALAVLLPVKTVGVMGDARTYADVIALRSVDTWDFMTADFSPLPHDLLGRVATRIINQVRGVNRVVYDVSSKPPATVEWE
ncbi:MAG: GMP synthase [glutamine-hydrolyzing] [Calditrichaeota bacterium]|nr:GMP synthase [glutamine-hydrolyzing] [Calditrichota bacterium]